MFTVSNKLDDELIKMSNGQIKTHGGGTLVFLL